MVNLSHTEAVASRTLIWKDVDKFIFIWASELVIVYKDPDRGKEIVISTHAPEVLEDIYNWLSSGPLQERNSFDDEDSESGN
jgi:hypothetical protein